MASKANSILCIILGAKKTCKSKICGNSEVILNLKSMQFVGQNFENKKRAEKMGKLDSRALFDAIFNAFFVIMLAWCRSYFGVLEDQKSNKPHFFQM